MVEAFKPGTIVKFKIPDGAVGRISNFRKSYDWQIPGYLGEGFYSVIVEGRELIVKEDDIEVYNELGC